MFLNNTEELIKHWPEHAYNSISDNIKDKEYHWMLMTCHGNGKFVRSIQKQFDNPEQK